MISKLEPGGNRWKGKAQVVRGTSSVGGFDIYEPAKVLWFSYMEEIVCNRDDLIFNALFNFKPMKSLVLGLCENVWECE